MDSQTSGWIANPDADLLSFGHLYCIEAEMLHKGNKIAIGEQEGVLRFNAKGGNNHIDGFSYCDASFAKGTKVIGAVNGQVSID
ncbi:MAG: hypothetical protein KME47_14010 [Nodosilinea sp. WJT8-NPBG4]|jgi:hypothetical protein|nr:hypothetical protein [Nodosilinea sp. WJT8-NPBG4]